LPKITYRLYFREKIRCIGMKPSYQQLKLSATGTPLMSYWVIEHSFGFHWHYHEEYELCYVQNGAGTRLVGDSVLPFRDGDLVLLGPNLPHTWISKEYQNDAPDNMKVFVIQFKAELLAKGLAQYEELQPILLLLDAASRGIAFGEQISQTLHKSLVGLPKAQGFERLIHFLEIFNTLAQTPEKQYLASNLYSPQLGQENEKRIRAVCSHIHAHYTQPITLEEVAAIAAMNPSSFSRYFTKMIGQTFVAYLNEIRVAKACQLLIESNQLIADIVFRSGFSSFTHFNKCFLKRTQLSPRDYRKRYGQL